MKTATIAMDNYSFETIEAMKELRDMRERAQRNIAACRRGWLHARPRPRSRASPPTWEVHEQKFHRAGLLRR